MRNEREIKQRLVGAGIRSTRGRIIVMDLLISAERPLTQHEVLEQVQGTGLHRVTVYRILQSLTDVGLIHRIEAGDRLWRFAACECGKTIHCHPHFTCRNCGNVECLFDVELPGYRHMKPGYSIESQEVYIHGLCANCRSMDAE